MGKAPPPRKTEPPAVSRHFKQVTVPAENGQLTSVPSLGTWADLASSTGKRAVGVSSFPSITALCGPLKR